MAKEGFSGVVRFGDRYASEPLPPRSAEEEEAEVNAVVIYQDRLIQALRAATELIEHEVDSLSDARWVASMAARIQEAWDKCRKNSYIHGAVERHQWWPEDAFERHLRGVLERKRSEASAAAGQAASARAEADAKRRAMIDARNEKIRAKALDRAAKARLQKSE